MRINVLTFLILLHTGLYAQLLTHEHSWKNMTDNGTISLLPRINGQGQFYTEFSIIGSFPIQEKWRLTNTVSTREVIYPNGISYCVRSNHVMFDNSIERSFVIRNKGIDNITLSGSGTMHVGLENTLLNVEAASWLARVRLHNGAQVSFETSVRKERILEPFEMGSYKTHAGKYTMRQSFVKYEGPVSKNSKLAIEGTSGSFYGHHRLAFRVGEELKIASGFKVCADVEYTRLSGEQSLETYLTRFNLQHTWSRVVTFDVFILNNTLNAISAAATSLTLKYGCARMKIEYRELRNSDLSRVESNHWFFSSSWLVATNIVLN